MNVAAVQTNLGCPGVPYTPELYFVNSLGQDPQATAAAAVAEDSNASGHDADGGVGVLALLRLDREFDRSIQWAAVEASEFDEKGVTLQEAAASLVLTDSGVEIDWCWSRNGTFNSKGVQQSLPAVSLCVMWGADSVAYSGTKGQVFVLVSNTANLAHEPDTSRERERHTH